MKRIKIIKNRVAALCLSMFLALGLIAPAFNFEAKAEALPQVLESGATIADCVMSYYAMSGAAVANTDWINTLYSSLGSDFGTIGQFADQGLMTYVDGVWQPVEQLAQNISETTAYTKLGLDNVFNVSAEEVATGGGYAVTTGASTLAGAVGCVATNGILPVLGGVTAAYWGGIAVGTLVAHLTGLYGKAISNNLPIDTIDYLSSIPDGYGICGYSQKFSNPANNYTSISSCPSKIFGVAYKRSATSMYVTWYIYNTANSNISVTTTTNYVIRDPITSTRNVSVSNNVGSIQSLTTDNMIKCFNLKIFNTSSEATDYINSIKSGNRVPYSMYSPDVIGPDGNQNGNYNRGTGEYQVPNMLPQIDPGIQSGKPLSIDDWLAFANGVQNNNNGVTPIPDNSALFQDLIDAIRQNIPGVDPGPGTDPGTVPVPTPNPNPDYDVDQPDTNAQESETPETDPNLNPPDFVLPDLMEKFPFCIPNDIATIFGKFRNQTRQAPYISWRFNPPGTPIDYTFDLNLSEFEEVATLLRTLELIAFVVGLAYATRYLIGSS